MKKPKLKPDDEPKAAPTPVVLPAEPWIVRAPAGNGEKRADITDAGLDAVRILAASGGSQGLIAGRLGLGIKTFRAMMQRDEKVRVAWESGLAEEEYDLVRGLRLAASQGFFVPALFLLKTRHNFVEGAAPASTAPNITLVLPDSRSPEDYLRVINAPAITESKS